MSIKILRLAVIFARDFYKEMKNAHVNTREYAWFIPRTLRGRWNKLLSRNGRSTSPER